MLIKASSVIGLKVLTSSGGEDIDAVKDIVYDPGENRVAALLVDNKGWFKDAKVILFEDIQTIGKDRVIVDSSDVIKTAGEVEENIADIARSDNYLTKTRIITEDGAELGSVTDIYFDSDTGQVTEFQVSQGALKDVQSGRKRVRVSDIVTVGKDATIVRAYTEEALEAQANAGGVQGAVQEGKAKIEDVAAQARANLQSPETQAKLQQVKDKAQEIADQVKTGVQDAAQQAREKMAEMKNDPRTQQQVEAVKGKAEDLRSGVAEKVDSAKEDVQDKREQDSVGNVLTKEILGRNDEVLAHAGDVVTNELIQKAKTEGILEQVLGNNMKPGE